MERYTCKKDKSDLNFQTFKKIEKNTRLKVRQLKADFEKRLAQSIKENPKSFYSYANKKVNKSSIGPLKIGTDIITDEMKIAEELNKFFVSVFTEDNLESIPSVDLTTDASIKTVVINNEIVLKEIEKLKVNKAPGPDNISSYLLKQLKDQLAIPLTIILKNSLQDGSVPSSWKEANITPIFKKGSKHSPGNYRPISLTSVPGKILETIIKKQFLSTSSLTT